MKFNFNKKYFNIAKVAVLVTIVLAIVIYALFHLDGIVTWIKGFISILSPVIFGLVIAYLFCPLINFFERKIIYPFLLRKKDYQSTISKGKRTAVRVVSLIISVFIVCFILSMIVKSIIPQVAENIGILSVQVPNYLNSLTETLVSLSGKNEFLSKLIGTNIEKPMAGVYDIVDSVLDDSSSLFEKITQISNSEQVRTAMSGVWSGLLSLLIGLKNFLIGAIISIYVLLNKEVFCGQAKKIMYAILPKERANSFIKDVRFVSDTFVNFIVGKIVDSLIIGVLCFICCNIFRFPYPLLISVIIGVTNIIPVFGPFIGAIPAALLILVVDPIKCLYFIIFIIILQQIDGNIIGPKILGNSTGISGFWVIFAITVFGGFWGVWGMLIGIPIFAVIYALTKRHVDRWLENKGLPTETYEYMPLKRIEDDGSITVLQENEDDFYLKERERRQAEKEARAEKKATLKINKDTIDQNIDKIVSSIKSKIDDKNDTEAEKEDKD